MYVSSGGLVSVIAAYKTVLTFALLTLNTVSVRKDLELLASLFVPIINLGWYTIQAALYGHLCSRAVTSPTPGREVIC